MDLTGHWAGITAIIIFVLAYSLVIAEEFTHLRKSVPVILAAGVIWAVVAIQYAGSTDHEVEHAVREFLIEFGELFLFLLAAKTYVNAMSERREFDALRGWHVQKGFGYRQLFWITGIISFFLSPVIDNLTTALVMCAVVMAVGKENRQFIGIGCVNIVVAANAGGAFSPFGDITTLMVWQRGILDFGTFFALIVPSAVNYLIPAAVMSLAVDKTVPEVESSEEIIMKRGAKRIMFLFICTVTTAVSFHNFLHLPPFLGMMTGLAYLKVFGHYLNRTHIPTIYDKKGYGEAGDVQPFDSFREVARAEWDTLLFFFGVIMCVGGLGFIGYLQMAAQFMYVDLGPTIANSLVGVLSAIVDNIPVMVAVLQMRPEMDVMQWLLVTLTAGVGGSMLSIGSAAGVALMGQARGIYTFFGHLKWAPVIALGYGASIWIHLLWNSSYAGVMP